jgi:uncharacterized protein (DUF2141 family)
MKLHAARTLPLVALFGLALSASPPAVAGGAAIDLTVVGIKAVQGTVMIALYDEKGWSGGAALGRFKVAVDGETVETELLAPGPGRYGLKLYQDVNGNGELDSNVVGIPTEPFGFSNDAPVRFGPPAFADAAFEVASSGATQTITLK